MYRTVICATLSGTFGCGAAPFDDVDFSSAGEPVRLATELTLPTVEAVSKVAGESAIAADPTQSYGDCEVVLSIDVEGTASQGKSDGGVPFIALGDDAGDGGVVEAELRVWAQNRSPHVASFRYLSPGCPAPALLRGLPEGYDAYGLCELPACDLDAGGARVMIKPGQRIPLGRARVSAAPNACNEAGLAPGRYVVTATLGEVDGARVCTRQPFDLEVR